MPLRNVKRPSLAILLGSVLLAQMLGGCAGYQLGPTNGRLAGGQSIQVDPFSNKTMEPRLSEVVTSSVRKQLQQDGTFRLNTSNEGDIIVTGRIMRYDHNQLTFRPSDTRTPRDYTVSITAKVTARERSSGKVILERSASGRTTLRVGEDLTSAERQAIPLAAEDLAHNITSLLVDGEW